MNWRVRFSVALYIFVTQELMARTIRWIAGKDRVADVMRGMLEVQRSVIQTLPETMAAKGLARESSELLANVDRVAANLKPDSQWVFHGAQWGDYEVTVMPRVIDSNTGVVVGPPGHFLLGCVVTNDHCAPNCEPAALHSILNGPPPPTTVDAEFVA